MKIPSFLLLLLLSVSLVLQAQIESVEEISAPSLFSEGSKLLFTSDFSGSPGFYPSRLPYFQLAQMAVMDNREDFLSKLNNKNHFGTFVSNSIVYASGSNNLAGIDSLRFVVRLNNQYQQNVMANSGLVNLFFKGNADRAGESVPLSPFYYYASLSQSLGLSVYKQLSHESATTFLGGGISFVLSGYYNEMSIENGSLFTSLSGDSLSVAADFNMLSSQAPYSSDKGFKLDFMYAVQSGDLNYGLSLSGLGMLFLSPGNLVVQMDTQLSYTGVDFVNPAHKGNTVLAFADTFKNISSSDKSERVILYPRIHAYAVKKNVFWSASVWASADWQLGYHYLPALSAGIYRELAPEKLWLSAGLVSDRYGHPGLLTGMKYQPFTNLTLNIGTQHLESPLLFHFNGFNLSFGVNWGI